DMFHQLMKLIPDAKRKYEDLIAQRGVEGVNEDRLSSDEDSSELQGRKGTSPAPDCDKKTGEGNIEPYSLTTDEIASSFIYALTGKCTVASDNTGKK
ncbi:hypothetical protein SK128_022898, partial [Halocaridina rubra]